MRTRKPGFLYRVLLDRPLESNGNAIVTAAATEEIVTSTDRPSESWRLWIDGCGGYAVLSGQQWTIGAAIPESDADIRVRADLARLAGQISFSGEDYFWQSEKVLDGGQVRQLLGNDGLLPIDSSAQLRFHRPTGLSRTGVLTLRSQHRFDDHVDAVLLCGDTILIGPSTDKPHRDGELFRSSGVGPSRRQVESQAGGKSGAS